MKNLVIAVSPDSSLELLSNFADIIVLDKDVIEPIETPYNTVYIRSHFSQESTLPQNFRNEIDSIVQQVKAINPDVTFIDDMDNVDSIVAFEDKWLQYKTFGEFMPRTVLYDGVDVSSFVRPVYKKRLSSRGTGVTWNAGNVVGSAEDWLVQESINIQEELRIYIIYGEIYPVGAVKQSMTEGNKAQGTSSRALNQDEIEFSSNLIKKAPTLDIVGIDIARTDSGELKLMEVNRSPGFAKFYDLTGFNLADKLYATHL